jgi:hypothetical protein
MGKYCVLTCRVPGVQNMGSATSVLVSYFATANCKKYAMLT